MGPAQKHKQFHSVIVKVTLIFTHFLKARHFRYCGFLHYFFSLANRLNGNICAVA
jgi:hypothetical protein